MHLVMKRMARLIEELLQEQDKPVEERFNAIILQMEAFKLPVDPKTIEKARKLWMQAVAERQGPRKT